MLFSSLIFLFVFLPLLLLTYYVCPKRFRNPLLLAASLFFYAWGGIYYSFILIASIGANYLLVRQIEKSKTKRKFWLGTGLVLNILVIVIFKYLDFIIDNVNGLGYYLFSLQPQLDLQEIILPLGISFFTFQQMSLLWDVYRAPDEEPSNFQSVALYTSLFPQLIAGPIVRYKDIVDQIKGRQENIDLFKSGIYRFILGLFKKIVFANTCGAIADSIMDTPYENLNSPIAWLGIVAYSLQIYFDFSGYSDMAIGLGRMFGFELLENFNFPYISTSIKEFWRRWHISLSTWFRDYVYIPLGGNRKGLNRNYINLITVFLLTGLWHGATWSFVIWGLFHGCFLIIEKLGLEKILNKLPRFVRWAYTIMIVMLAWVLFRIEHFSDAIGYIGKLFGIHSYKEGHFLSYLNNEKIVILLFALLSCSTFFAKLKIKMNKTQLSFPRLYSFTSDFCLMGLFILSIIYINSGSYNPFIYFRF
mgnify:CR=1 FL=1